MFFVLLTFFSKNNTINKPIIIQRIAIYVDVSVKSGRYFKKSFENIDLLIELLFKFKLFVIIFQGQTINKEPVTKPMIN
jgi:hypothetical protein